MSRHMIVEIALLILCTISLVAAYACCVISGKCSRTEEKKKLRKEQEEILKGLYDNPDWMKNLKADSISADKILVTEWRFDPTAKTTPPIVGKGGEKDGRINDIL